MKAIVAALLIGVALPAGAEVLVGEPLGEQVASPEDLQVFDDRIRMAARLVFSGTDDLADRVDKPARIDLEMGFMTSADVAPEDVRLRCKVFFVDPGNQVSRIAKDVICYKGNLGEVAGKWVPMRLDFTFKPVTSDPKGTSGVRVEVKDQVSGEVAYFMPTYDWQGGQE